MKFNRTLPFFIGISVAPFVWLYTNATVMANDYLYATANITGLVGTTLMLWQFILGIRFIAKKISPDYLSLIKLHTKLGIWGGLLVFAHPLLEMNIYGKSLNFLYTFNLSNEFEEHVTFGRIALILFLFIWISSALLRNKIKRRPWLYIHYLTYPMLFLAFIHAVEIGSFLLEFPVVRLYWFFLGFVFAVACLYRGLHTLTIFQKPYVLLSKESKKGEIFTFQLKPLTQKSLHPKIGQFIYVRAGLISEAHPFTVMKFDEKTSIIELGIKSVGNYTQFLSFLDHKAKIYLDGPYGVFTQNISDNLPIIIFAGGIGITPFVDLVTKKASKNMYLFYANKTLNEALFRDVFVEKLGHNYIDVISREITKLDRVIHGRLTSNAIKNVIPEDIVQRAQIFVCGSKSFMDGVETYLSELGVPKKQVFKEEFGF